MALKCISWISMVPLPSLSQPPSHSTQINFIANRQNKRPNLIANIKNVLISVQYFLYIYTSTCGLTTSLSMVAALIFIEYKFVFSTQQIPFNYRHRQSDWVCKRLSPIPNLYAAINTLFLNQCPIQRAVETLRGALRPPPNVFYHNARTSTIQFFF